MMSYTARVLSVKETISLLMFAMTTRSVTQVNLDLVLSTCRSREMREDSQMRRRKFLATDLDHFVEGVVASPETDGAIFADGEKPAIACLLLATLTSWTIGQWERNNLGEVVTVGVGQNLSGEVS